MTKSLKNVVFLRLFGIYTEGSLKLKKSQFIDNQTLATEPSYIAAISDLTFDTICQIGNIEDFT
jgi:hypothetical protein